jgi:hypothetical protein
MFAHFASGGNGLDPFTAATTLRTLSASSFRGERWPLWSAAGTEETRPPRARNRCGMDSTRSRGKEVPRPKPHERDLGDGSLLRSGSSSL